ncbi:MAG: ABC transporter ATP-binding protein [Candidatus Acidiferrales bacterium]
MIRVENLTKEYDLSGKRGHVLAADRLSLHIPAGEIFGLVGPNGAGKTTTLKMICGLLMPSAGRVTVNGIDVEREPEEAQKHIGYLADFFSLYDDLKSWEYLDFFCRAYKMDAAAIAARITQVIGLMGLESKRDAFIHGLSRGMKQRLGIARAILHDPPVLVLDEPASGLDPKARHELKLLIKELHRAGKTIFITSHVLSDLEEICTSIGILEKGKLVRLGPLEQILRGEGAAASGARRVRIRLATPGFALTDWLRARPGVTNVGADVPGSAAAAGASATPAPVSAAAGNAVFQLAGSETDLADLVRALVGAGAPVCGVEEITESLEQLFFRISSGEVM